LAVGNWFVGAGVTVTTAVSLAVAPALSVTVSRAVNVPALL